MTFPILKSLLELIDLDSIKVVYDRTAEDV